MERDFIYNRVQQIVQKKAEIDNELDADLSLVYVVTSMDFFSMLSEIEKEFQFEIKEEDLKVENFMTVNKIIDYVRRAV